MKKFFNRSLKILLVTNGLILISAAMLAPIYAIFVEKIGGDLLDASIAGCLLAFSAGLVTLLSGNFSDKIRHSEYVMITGYVLIGAGFLLYYFVNSVPFLFFVQILIGLGEAIYSPAFDKLYSDHLDKEKSGTEWGAWESMNYFTTAAGALFGGLIVSYFGFSAIFSLMAILSFGSAVYLSFFVPRRVF